MSWASPTNLKSFLPLETTAVSVSLGRFSAYLVKFVNNIAYKTKYHFASIDDDIDYELFSKK
jgi:hypothetical protein